MRTQVAIIGAGPAGLMLSRRLTLAGVDNVLVEHKSLDHVLERVRAGVLEPGTVALLDQLKVSDRLHREAILHDACAVAFDGRVVEVPLKSLTGEPVTIYGQTEITRDLVDASPATASTHIYSAADVAVHDFDTDHPRVTFRHDGAAREIRCEIIAGCDGYHGVCRASVPSGAMSVVERTYPFAWLGVLSRTPPVSSRVLYATHARGFALCSMRSTSLSRYYVQCAANEDPDNWTDARFWDELRRRLPDALAQALVTGPSLEKSVAPLRSYVGEPLRFGRLFLAGDAAHIVPPTGAKGLNLAASDVHYLGNALLAYLQENDTPSLDDYSARSLRRVWGASRFSWWFTGLTHRFGENPFEERMQLAELEYLENSRAAMTTLAENYVGLPL